MTTNNSPLSTGLTARTQAARGALGALVRQALRPERYRWWHAAGVGLAANLLSFPFYGLDNTIYESFVQAPFAPPAWLFAPVWTLNNISVLWGNLRLANLPAETPSRRTLLWLQGASWALFTSFGLVYFGLQSPILAFTTTVAMYALTIASAVLSWKVDRKIVLSLVTLLLWLSLATVVAAYQMIFNADPFFGTAALR